MLMHSFSTFLFTGLMYILGHRFEESYNFNEKVISSLNFSGTATAYLLNAELLGLTLFGFLEYPIPGFKNLKL